MSLSAFARTPKIHVENLNFERIEVPNEDDLRHYQKYRQALGDTTKGSVCEGMRLGANVAVNQLGSFKGMLVNWISPLLFGSYLPEPTLHGVMDQIKYFTISM